jgi:molybdopterin synthase catalytic subunit
MLDVQIKEEALQVEECFQLVQDAAVGGTALFVGTVRNTTKGRSVVQLDFEAYVPMAVSEMRKIGEAVQQKWHAQQVCIHHRIGTLQVGEIAVLIAVATPHRKAAFEACQYAIDTLKETVPIWKKEIFEDGEVWVSAHP